MIGSHFDQYLRMIHFNIITEKKKKKESSILAWNVQNFTWVLFYPPPPSLIQRKQSLTPVGLVIQTREIFPPFKKKKKETEISECDWT